MACTITTQIKALKDLKKVLSTDEKTYKDIIERINYELDSMPSTKEDSIILKSEPSDTVSAVSFDEVIKSDEIYNKEKVRSLLKNLVESDKVSIDEKHAKHLENVINKILDPVMKALPEMSVYMNDKAEANGGRFEIKNGTAGVYLGRGNKEQTYGNEMSIAEKFVHEMVHGATHFAMNYNKQEIAGTLNKLDSLHKTAMKHLTVEDLMPDVSLDEKLERKIAEDRLNYINDNQEEFLAYAVTHEKVMNKLSGLTVDTEVKKGEGFTNAIMYYLNKLVNFVMAKWGTDPKSVKGDILTMKLMSEIMQANNTAVRETERNVVDNISELVDTLEDKWNELIEKASNKVLKTATTPPPTNSSKTEKTKWLAANLHQILLNKDNDGILEGILTATGAKPDGFVQTQLRMLREKDDHQKAVEDIMMWSGQVERQREGMAGQIGSMITSMFNRKKIKPAHRTAIYKMIVKDDSAVLLEKYGKQLVNFYKNKSTRDTEIKKLDKKLESLSGKDITLYRARIEDLVNYMQTGKGTMLTARNAEAIAKKVGTARPNMAVSQDIIDTIDELVSLKNIEHNSERNIETIVDLLENEYEAIEVATKLQSGAIRTVRDRMTTAERLNLKKGYVREVYDDAITSTIAPYKDRQLMLDKGYTEVVELPMTGVLGSMETKMAMYISRDMIRQKLNRSTMRYTGDKQEGRTLFENAFKSGGKAAIKNIERMKSKLNAETSKVILDAMQGKAKNLDAVVTPEFDENGNITEYRYNVEMAHKQEYLGLETDGIEGIARSWAHEVDIEESDKINEAAFNEVVFQMAKDYRGARIGISSKEYVMLNDKSSDPTARAYARILPKAVKKKMKKLQEAPTDDLDMVSNEMAKEMVGIGWDELTVLQKENIRLQLGKKEIWIRKDMLHDVLGVRDMSIVNAPLIKNLPIQLKTMLLRFENFWKQVIQLFKVNIVIKLPTVLIENIISNIMYGIQTGQNPVAIWKTYRDGWNALNKFTEDEKRLNEVKALLVTDSGNKELIREKNRIEESMRRSPIKPLVDAGLYSHIMEDLNAESFKSSNKIANWMNEKLEGAPEIIKEGANFAYVTEKTSMFQMAQNMTAKSDFLARYSQYVYEMEKATRSFEKKNNRKITMEEKGKLEKQVLREVRDTFINYVKPDDPFMQYLNDMGLFLFTKYAIRITRVAKNLITKHPLRFSAALLGQEVLESTVGYNPSDTMQSSVFTKGIDDWFYSPDAVDILTRLAIPPIADDIDLVLKAI